MLQAYTSTTQALGVNEVVTFDNAVINNTPCAISFTSGGSAIDLKKQGYYLVSFNADVVGTAAGDVIIQMYIDGSPVSYAFGSDTIDAIGDYANIQFSTIVPVKCSCCVVDNTQTITFVNTGVVSSLSLGNVVITKIA